MKTNLHIDEYGTKRWYNESGQLHRDENDLPAIIHVSGRKCWFRHGTRYRENNLPVIVLPGGHEEWWINGVCYRMDEWLTWQ